MMKTLSRIAPVVLCLVAAACEQPPTKEIGAAEAALEQARREGADLFAPDRFGDAQAALADAQKKLEARDYRGALSSATDAAEKSRSASQVAASARQIAREEANMAEASAQAALDEVASIRAQAAKAKIPDKAFGALLQQAADASTGLDSVARALAEGKILEAKALATEIKVNVTPLPRLFREAQAKWEAAHPKSRRPRKP